MEPAPPPPEEELRILRSAVGMTADLPAGQEHLALLELRAGLERAEGQERSGVAWGPPLAAEWRLALADFIRLHDQAVLLDRAVPEQELWILDRTVEDASGLAADDRRERAYLDLRGGLERAQQMQREGAPWSARLAARWQSALNDFLQHHPRELDGEEASSREGESGSA